MLRVLPCLDKTLYQRHPTQFPRPAYGFFAQSSQPLTHPYHYCERLNCDGLHILITFIYIITPLLTSTHKTCWHGTPLFQHIIDRMSLTFDFARIIYPIKISGKTCYHTWGNVGNRITVFRFPTLKCYA